MKKIPWQATASVGLMLLSTLLYSVDFKLFGDSRRIIESLIDNTAFVFIQILLVAIIVDSLLKRADKQNKMEKLNMVIGIFFNEIGSRLLTYFSRLDTNIESVRGELQVTGKWIDSNFAAASKKLLNYKYELKVGPADLEQISHFLKGERDFLLRLLENPVLLEHETFTELLMAVFHLADEFANREEFAGLPESDLKHLEGDIKRAYDLTIREWLVYMNYLKFNYPYLFSLAIRTNPFDKNACAIVTG